MKKTNIKTLKTYRLILRKPEMADAEVLYKVLGMDPLYDRYINFNMFNSPESAENFVKMHQGENTGFYGWTVTLEGNPIGTMALFDVDEKNESAEIGASLASGFWNRGYMSEALSAVISFAFTEIELNRLIATCHTENTGSRRIMEKNLMKREGILRQAQKNKDGSFSDLYLYSILREQYNDNTR